MSKKQLALSLCGLGLVILLPLLGHWLRRSGEPVCALDGLKIDPAYRVRIEDSANQSHTFCCLRCAELWLDRHGRRPRAIFVTDEPSGEEIPAAAAHYVRSLVVIQANLNRVHVFKHRMAAENHARLFRGTILSDGEKPFAAPP